LFIAGTEPTTQCTLHRRVPIDVTTGLVATQYCPPEAVVERTFTYYPPEALDWAREEGLALPPESYCRVHRPAQASASPGRAESRPGPESDESEAQGLELTEPDPNLVFRLSPELPLADQRIEIAARPNTSDHIQEVRFLVDDELLSTTSQPPYRVMWPLSPGQHTIRAQGCTSEGARVESRAIEITVLK